MKIKICNSLLEINNKLDKVVQKLSVNWEGKKVEVGQYDDELKSIKKFIEINRSFISKNPDTNQTLYYIQTVKRLLDLTKKVDGQDEYFATEMKTTAFFFKNLSKDKVKDSVDTIGMLKTVDRDLYLDTLAEWINTQKIPIKELGLGEEEMLKLAPKLTHLDLADGEWDEMMGIVKNCIFSENFIERMLYKSSNLNSLLIKNATITDKALAQLPKLQKLQQLTIARCPAFNQQLPELQALQQLTIDECDTFNQLLPELRELQQLIIRECRVFNRQLPELQALQQLTIENCYAFNRQLPELQALQQLIIKWCYAFNQPLSGLQKLQQLTISSCGAFNQPLPKWQELQQLTIIGSYDFNQSLPKMKKLQQLTIASCGAFNRQLPELRALQQLIIVSCDAFNQPLPELQELQRLRISRCPAFNQQLPELQALQQLAIINCSSFNQPLPELRELQQLRIEWCHAFNQPLPELQALQQLKISRCDNFNPFDHHANTVWVVLRFELDLFFSAWNGLSTEQQVKYKENNPKMAAKIDIFLTLADIDDQVNEGEPSPVIDVSFSSIREQENYTDYLKEAIQHFPLLASYLIQNHREEIMQDIKKIGVSFDDLSKESRLALLPLFPPENIQKAIVEIPQKEKEGWLRESIQFEQFSGAIKDVLKDIKINNIDSGEESVFDNLGSEFRELFQKIPLKTIAALASDDSNAGVVLAYLPIMDDVQVAVVIPLLSAKQFTEHVRGQSLPIHKDLLFHATFEQKELYLRDDLIQSPDLRKWERDFKPKLEQLIEAFNKDSTVENYQKLDFEWSSVHSSIGTAINHYKVVLNSLEKVLSVRSVNDEILGLIKITIDNKTKQTKIIEKELEQKKNLIATELAEKLPKEEEVSDEFIDVITMDLMEDPWKDAYGNVLDKTTWDKSDENPFTRKRLSEDPISFDKELKGRIDEFKEKYPDLWKKKTFSRIMA